MSRNQAAVECVRRIAVEDLVLSQENKPTRHRSARIKLSFSIQVYTEKIIHRDLQLTCFKQCRAQLLSEANRISHLIR